MTDKFVLDTSIIIDGKATEMINSGEIARGSEVVIPKAALDELQAQASKHREEGFVGLEELTRLRSLGAEKNIKIDFEGERPSMDDIRLAKSGRIDAIIRDVAKVRGATLITADYVQALVGRAEGISVKHIPSEVRTIGLEFEKLFDDKTLSLHLKEGVVPCAKKGVPGNFDYIPIAEKESEREDLERIAKEISEAARISAFGSVEISRSGATVIQLGAYRIAIARPPFSDGLEVTVVRPLVKLSLSDYHLSDRLIQRLETKSEGIIIAGPPGSGKSTLASSVADFYLGRHKVVKTFESPKDLQVAKGITQYGPLEGDFEKTSEILLLVRPDYTIFDEVRRTRDFQIFADMRLAGVGMVGVVHASDPVNAVQRFMSRIELGMIPHIVDTVIFVRAGKIEQVLDLTLVVKVPTGMNEPDLSRPVVEVKDFETGELIYEIYTFGEENIVIPVKDLSQTTKRTKSGVEKLASERIVQFFRKYDPNVEVRILSPSKAQVLLPEDVIPRVIGRGGSQIKETEQLLSMGLDIRPREDSGSREHKPMRFDYREKGNSIEVLLNSDSVGRTISVLVEGDEILKTKIGRKPRIKVSKKSEVGRMITQAVRDGKDIHMETD